MLSENWSSLGSVELPKTPLREGVVTMNTRRQGPVQG